MASFSNKLNFTWACCHENISWIINQLTFHNEPVCVQNLCEKLILTNFQEISLTLELEDQGKFVNTDYLDKKINLHTMLCSTVCDI